MSDTASWTPQPAARRMTDALLRSVGGAQAYLRVAAASNTDTAQSEIGIAATAFAEVVVSPVVIRQNRPGWKENDQAKYELLISAMSIEAQVSAGSFSSAQALFQQTVSIGLNGREFLIESIGASEAFGRVYVYRLLVREAVTEAV